MLVCLMVIEIPVENIFYRNVGVHGGPAPVRAYIPELLDDVLKGHINPGRIFDFKTDLNGIAEAYAPWTNAGRLSHL